MRALLLFVLLLRVQANLIDTETNQAECEGSVILYEGDEETVVSDYINVAVKVDRVVLQGCGCFILNSRKNGKGKSYFLKRKGEHTAEEIGWNKVKSVRRVACQSLAMPVWVIILIVVMLVLITAMLAIYCFKKFHNHEKYFNVVSVLDFGEI